MNTKARAMIKAGTALALTSFVWTGAVMAQDNTTVANLPTPADNAASCKAMIWNSKLVGTYPWVSEACHEVVVVNDEKWARFEGKYKRSNSDGSFDTEFVNRSDRRLGSVTLMPEPGQRAHIDNREVRFSDLRRDQVLSFYVPEGEMGFAVKPGAPRTQLVKVVETNDEPQSGQLAQADTREEERVSVLPRTAGPLPLFALGGLMSLLGGLGLTIRRKSSKHNI